MPLSPSLIVLVASLTAVAGQTSNDALDRRVRVHNQTGVTVERIEISASGRARSRSVALSTGSLRPGQSVVMIIDDGTGACVYDLHAAFSDGEASDRAGINVCEISDYYLTR